eukprot:COSAG02_NODE_66151_length_256_cov_0.656051_1_plen_34_part_10
MDAMAAKAAHGFSVFCRQDFIGADYVRRAALSPQ